MREAREKSTHVISVEFPLVSALFYAQRDRGVTSEHWSTGVTVADKAQNQGRKKRGRPSNGKKRRAPRGAGTWGLWVKEHLQENPRKGFGGVQLKGLGAIYKAEQQSPTSILHNPRFQAAATATQHAAQAAIEGPSRGVKRALPGVSIVPAASQAVSTSAALDILGQKNRRADGRFVSWRASLAKPWRLAVRSQAAKDRAADDLAMARLHSWKNAQPAPRFMAGACVSAVAEPGAQHMGMQHYHCDLSLQARRVGQTVCRADPYDSATRARNHGLKSGAQQE